jgi:hypothetical protein
MAHRHDPSGLTRDWSAFLERDADARIVVNGLMVRTGLTTDEALFYLIAEWARVHLMIENYHAS